jgi:hypothetical protein
MSMNVNKDNFTLDFVLVVYVFNPGVKLNVCITFTAPFRIFRPKYWSDRTVDNSLLRILVGNLHCAKPHFSSQCKLEDRKFQNWIYMTCMILLFIWNIVRKGSILTLLFNHCFFVFEEYPVSEEQEVLRMDNNLLVAWFEIVWLYWNHA